MSLRLPVLVSGDSRTQLLPATDPATGLPLTIPITATLIFTAKHSKYAPDVEAVFQKVSGAGITFSGSTITVEIVSADTEPLEEYTDLVCDVQMQDVSLGILTIWEGVLPVRIGVTQETMTSVPVYTQNPPLPGGGGDMYTAVYDPDLDGKVIAAVQADVVPWAGVTGHPTTLAGYGITDVPGGGGDMLKSVYDPDNDGKVSSAVAADSVPWAGITSKPATFPPSAHSHAQSDVTGLVSALAAKADGASLSAHVADTANPHAVTKAQVGLALADNTPDTGKPVSTAMQTALDGKAASSHTHATADVIGFAAAAAAAAPVQSVAGLTGAMTAAALRTALSLVVGTDVQAFDSDLAAIAALTTTAFGRSLLTQADATAIRATIGAGVSNFDGVFASLTSRPTTLAGYGITDAQPLDADLTAIAALTTTGFGRSLLTQADAAAARATIGAGTSSFDGAFSSLTGAPTTLAGYGITDAQPLDADLTAIAALTTTAFGRSVLTQADGPAVRTLIGAGTSSFDGVFSSLTSKPTTLAGYGITDAQPLDSDLTAIAALTTTSFGRSVLTQADAAAVRTLIGAGTSSFDGVFSSLTSIPTTLAGYGITDAQGLDSDLTALANNATNGMWARTGAGTGAARTITGTTNQVTVTNGDGVSGNPTLALPQDIHSGASPTFAALTITGGAVIEGLTYGRGGGAASTNTAVGVNVLLANTVGGSNTGVGHASLTSNTTGTQNAGLGRQSLNSNTTGSNNMAIGRAAMQSNTTGSQNTAVGTQALQNLNITDGSNGNNTAIGFSAGLGITTGTGNTIIGANVTGLSSSLTNNIILANGTGAIKAQHDGTDWTFTSGIKTANPSGGTAQIVKFGSFVSGAPTATGYQQIEIAGVAYKLLAVAA